MPPSSKPTPTKPTPTKVPSAEPALATVTIAAWAEGRSPQRRPDEVIVEAPLLIRLGHTRFNDGEPQLDWHDLVVTMRSPGDDEGLAMGFLVAEGIIEHRSQVAAITAGPYTPLETVGGTAEDLAEGLAEGPGEASDWAAAIPGGEPGMVTVTLEPSVQISATCLNQRRLASSSCGICGKTALGDLLKRTAFPRTALADSPLSLELLARIDSQTRGHQPLFQRCGAVHSCGLFTASGECIAMFEDVGRHNAFDKLVGYLCRKDQLPAGELIVWLSGRVSYELTQKAIMAGVGTLIAVGAPSQLAVHLANQARIRLLGFADGRRGNVYTGVSG